MVAAPEGDENGQTVTDRKLAVPDGPKGVTTFTPEQVEAARAYADASRAASTRAKYLQHWTAFGRWCQEVGHRPLPAEPAVVAVHLSGLAAAGTAPQTLALRMAAIGYAHRQAGEVPPHKVRGCQRRLNPPQIGRSNFPHLVTDQSRPYPRGGSMSASSVRSRLMMACKASAVAVSRRASGRALAQAA